MVGIFIVYSRYAFHFFDSFCYILIFFSLSHRTCYLEGIVSLLLVWSVYSYVFFLSVLFVCSCSSPASSKLQPPPHFANSIQLHLTNLSPFQPSKPIHPSHSYSPTKQHRPKPKTEQKKRKEKKKTTQPNPNTHTQKPPNSALEYPNYTQTAPNNYSPNSP